ncbi:SagB/ThcOx family dehydrogenase [Clostridium folliculivorans]|uniref:Thioester oxidase n=1 Tax=Clostridium folliculivorans TaxID=2886038 RepID=A0A9W6D9G2_9CLOT|nr:SagB/ThcOx family dehydrogenase [Clostridium folliculivorans]GKU24285.1 thioester oxidase [Clostridium folliculivorans]GKU30390.1 thioester oxidase [Clostridium folliculivorans]
MGRYDKNREFLKANFEILDDIKTDAQKKLPKAPLQKEYDENAKLIDLPKPSKDILVKSNVLECIEDRRSVRKYSEESISLEELSFLLWSTQGVQKLIGNDTASLRTVPSGGASHTFETYLIVNNVQGLTKGIYRYIPIGHKLLFMYEINEMTSKIDEATPRQPFAPNFASKSAVLFVWSTIPYRAEWKFDITAHKKILIDVGHVCQNLYIASEAIKCGTCAIGIYDQKLIDNMLGLDGEDEFVIYLAAVGKV